MMSTKETYETMIAKLYDQTEIIDMWWEMSQDDKSCVPFWLQENAKLEGMIELVREIGFEIPKNIIENYTLENA